jgi:hypothetical protein
VIKLENSAQPLSLEKQAVEIETIPNDGCSQSEPVRPGYRQRHCNDRRDLVIIPSGTVCCRGPGNALQSIRVIGALLECAKIPLFLHHRTETLNERCFNEEFRRDLDGWRGFA